MKRSTGRPTRGRNFTQGLFHQASFLVFAGLSLALLLAGKLNPGLSELVQGTLLDGAAPVVEAVGEPVEAVRNFGRRTADLMRGADQVEALRQENDTMKRWRDVAMRLDQENAELRALLRVRDRLNLPTVTARVLSDPGGPFVRSVILDRGAREGIERHQPVLDETGLIGRIVTVGGSTSRTLLLTDFNSRVAVKVLRNGMRAVLRGDNSGEPVLSFLPIDPDIAVGDIIVTSGDGGLFPHDLHVGEVSSISGSTIRIRLAASLDRLDFVDVVGYSPPPPPEHEESATEVQTDEGERP